MLPFLHLCYLYCGSAYRPTSIVHRKNITKRGLSPKEFTTQLYNEREQVDATEKEGVEHKNNSEAIMVSMISRGHSTLT